jgi:hypothetical protein
VVLRLWRNDWIYLNAEEITIRWWHNGEWAHNYSGGEK